MKIFVGYGYNDRDRWIEEMVFPLIQSFGCQPVEGKILPGENLSSAVRSTLLQCDALFGFLTRRELMNDGRWTTHRWVVEELSTAFEQIPTVEIREEGVDPQHGMLGNQQRIAYREEERDRCIVKLAQVLGVLTKEFSQRTSAKNVRLGPEKFVDDVKRLVLQPGFKCQYRVLRGGSLSEYRPTEVQRVTGGLYVWLLGVAPQDLIEISVTHGTSVWRSDFESVDAARIHLSQE